MNIKKIWICLRYILVIPLFAFGILSIMATGPKPPPKPSPILRRTLSVPDVHGVVNDVIRVNSMVVAVGQDTVATGTDTRTAAVWVSANDGIDWTRVSHDDAVFGDEESSMNAVVAGGPGIVAVGYKREGEGMSSSLYGAVWTSSDGVNWSSSARAGGQLNDVIATPSGLTAVGEKGYRATVWSSSDGLSWSPVFIQSEEHPGSSPPINIRFSKMYAVAFGTTEFVAVGYYDWAGYVLVDGHMDRAWHRDAAIWTSSNGTDWAMLPPYDPIFAVEHHYQAGNVGDQSLYAVMISGRAIYVAGGDSMTTASPVKSLLWTSIDNGNTWKRYTDEYPECNPAFSFKHKILALVDPDAFGYGELAVGEVWEGDTTNGADGAVWRGATGYPRWHKWENDLLGGEGYQSARGAVGYKDDNGNDIIIIVGQNNGPAIWRYARPSND
jgi:hypothetical protein